MELWMDEKDELEDGVVDVSYRHLRAFNSSSLTSLSSLQCATVRKLVLVGNVLNTLPSFLAQFVSLEELDFSSNDVSWISGEICRLPSLHILVGKNNRLQTLPKEFEDFNALNVLNLSGNQFDHIPMQICKLRNLKELFLGGNRLTSVNEEIGRLHRLQVLYLGGNSLKTLPRDLGKLRQLRALILCDNHLVSIPRELAQLQSLHSLSLHKNRLKTLPMELLMLDHLQELSLRDNPLVHKFITDLNFNPPSLLELSGRSIKVNQVEYRSRFLPENLVDYLDSARQCINPKCGGVYFDSRIKCVKFVDFCGKYRLPLEQYICSPHSGDQCLYNEQSVPAERLKKVLLPFNFY